MTQDDASIVTTIDLVDRPAQLLRRLQRLEASLHAAGWKLVIAHNDRRGHKDAELQSWAKKLDSRTTRLISSQFYDGLVNNSLLRNRALNEVSTPVAILMDVDLYPDAAALADLLGMLTPQRPVAMLPVLYLTAQGTIQLARTGLSKPLAEDYLSLKRKLTQHIAAPSSFVAFHTAELARCGGFDEGYRGHGYEDFDFLLRLSLATGAIAPTDDLHIDEKTPAPLLARGFRARLGSLCLDALIEGRYGLHLHHPRADMRRHQQAQALNQKLFLSNLQNLVNGTTQANQGLLPPLLPEFYALCQTKGLDPRDLYAYLDTRPGHLLQPSWPTKILTRIAGTML